MHACVCHFFVVSLQPFYKLTLMPKRNIILFFLLGLFASVVQAQSPVFCMDGTLLFREDFGGNDPNDPDVSMASVPGMSSQYYNSGNSLGSGHYTIRKEGWQNGIQWHRQDDHTYPDDKTRGYLLEIDGVGGSEPFYSKTIEGLCEGSKLTFSAYVVNVHYAGQIYPYLAERGYVYPRLKFVLKNPTTGAVLASKSTGDIMPDMRYATPETWKYARDNSLSAEWQLVGMNFTVPPGVESIQMFIYNDVERNGSGNDFALDDIEIHLCAPPVTIEGETEVCENKPITLTANFTNDGTFAEPLEYKWWHSMDSITWTELSGSIGQNLTFDAVHKADSGWYKVAVSGAGNIEATNCRAQSTPFLMKVNECIPSVRILSPDSVCPNDPCAFQIEITNENTLQGPLVYQWLYRSLEYPTEWRNVSGGTVRELQIASFQTQHVGWYKLYVAEAGKINNPDERIESEEFFVTFKKCEPDLCTDGTLLYKDDFGGNSPSDPRVGQVPVQGMSYRQLNNDSFGRMGSGCYLVTKSGYCNGDTAAAMRNYGYIRTWDSQWILQDDHTYMGDYSRGYFVEIDGEGGQSPFYSTTISSLCPGSKLTFSAHVVNVAFFEWVQKMYRTNRSYSYPRLKFVLKNPVTGAVLAEQSTGDIQPDITKSWNILLHESAEWQLVGMNFTVPEGVEAITLTISNNTTGYVGNDFALDDIEIHLCLPPVTIDGEAEVCLESAASLTANFTNDGTLAEPLEYKWWHSEDSLVWTELPGFIGPNPTIDAVHKADSGWYKVAVSGAGNIESVNCRAVSDPFRLNVQACAPPPCPDLHYATRDTTVCDTLMPFTWHGLLFNEPGEQKTVEKDNHGCDTLQTTWTLLTQVCCPDIQTFTLDTTVCDTLMPFVWIGDGFEVPFSDIGTNQQSVPHPRWPNCLFAEYTLRLDTVHCERLYDIIVNKYNWVLLCNNTRVRTLFPQRTVIGYQWYKDGTAIIGATEDDYSEQNELLGDFQLRLHIDDGSYVWSEILTIQPALTQAPSRIRIYRHNGHLIYQAEGENTVPSLPRGLYIIQIEQNGEQRIEKKLIP